MAKKKSNKTSSTKGEAAATKCGALPGEKSSTMKKPSSTILSDDDRIEFHGSIYSYFRRLLLRERLRRLEKTATAATAATAKVKVKEKEGTVPRAPDDDGEDGSGAGGSDGFDGGGRDRPSPPTEEDPSASTPEAHDGDGAVGSIGILSDDGGAAASSSSSSADRLDAAAAVAEVATAAGVASSDDGGDADAVAKISAVLEALRAAFPESLSPEETAEGEGVAAEATDLEVRYASYHPERRGATEEEEKATKKSPGRSRTGGAAKDDSTSATRRRSSPRGKGSATQAKSPPAKKTRYNKIDPVLKSKMSALRTEARTYTWEERYEQLMHYRAGYGNCLIPRRSLTNQGLSNWVQKQRLLYKEMHAMPSSPSPLSLPLPKEEGTSDEAAAGGATQPPMTTPTTPTAATMPMLTPALSKSAKARSILTDERIDKLNAVGFVWRAQSHEVKSWDERFLDLVAFKSKHGHCNVPKNFRDDPSLAEFCKTQRRLYKARDDKYRPGTERVQRLEEIGFKFMLAPPIKRWEERFLQLVEFRRIHGHCRVPQPKAGKPAAAEVDVTAISPAPSVNTNPVDAVAPAAAAPAALPGAETTAAAAIGTVVPAPAGIVGPNGIGGEVPPAASVLLQPNALPQPNVGGSANIGDGLGSTAATMPPLAPPTLPVDPSGQPPSIDATTTAAVAAGSPSAAAEADDAHTMVGDNPDDERAFRRWANRQKSEFWKYRNDRTSSLDKARVKKLEGLGFDFGSTPLLHVAEAFAMNPALL